MRRAALRSALSVKAGNEAIVLVDELTLDAPKTRDMKQFVQTLVPNGSALVLLPGHNENVEKSTRNLADVKALQASYLNIRDLLRL
jgi:large subunit ribosomal protein L4